MRYDENCSVVDNATLFPYSNALCSLLDCYNAVYEDNMPQECGTVCLVAPLLFAANGHRRSKLSPRPDRHIVRVEELVALGGHLPNFA